MASEKEKKFYLENHIKKKKKVRDYINHLTVHSESYRIHSYIIKYLENEDDGFNNIY